MMWILAASFFLIILVLIIINYKLNSSFKIETAWIALAVSPAVIWLLSTGQLAEFSGFGLEFKLKEASAKPFSLSLEGDRIEPALVPLGEKEGLAKIPELIQRRVPALALQLNRRGYYSNWAIGQYLEQLAQHEFFRYVVFFGKDGKFRGIMPAKKLLTQMMEEDLNIVKIIEEGTIDRLDGLRTVSVPTASSKREALKIMEENEISELPVLNEKEQFVGVVEREKLTSSILLQLISQL